MTNRIGTELARGVPSQLVDALNNVLNQLSARKRRRRLVRAAALTVVLVVVVGLVAIITGIPTLPSGQPSTDDEV